MQDRSVQQRVAQDKKHLHVIIKSIAIPLRDLPGEDIPVAWRRGGAGAIGPILGDRFSGVVQPSAEVKHVDRLFSI